LRGVPSGQTDVRGRGRHVTALQRIRIGALRLTRRAAGRLPGPACRGAGAGFPAGIRFVKMTKISSPFRIFGAVFLRPLPNQQKIFIFAAGRTDRIKKIQKFFNFLLKFAQN
jgi:hypothetical protein